MSEKNNNSFETTVASLFKGMDQFISSKTVVGDAITVGNTIILPLVDVSFGVGAGASSSDSKNNGAGGLGGKISPSAVLVIQEGNIRLVNVRNQDAVTKILDMVPDSQLLLFYQNLSGFASKILLFLILIFPPGQEFRISFTALSM